MDSEIKGFIRHATRIRKTIWNKIVFYEGVLERKRVVIVKSGLGKVFAAVVCQKLIDLFKPSKIIFTGVAGGINSRLNIADVIISKDCMYHDLDCTAMGIKRGQIPFTKFRFFKADPKLRKLALKTRIEKHKIISGRILTGDQFLTKTKIKTHSYLKKELKGDCVEMEGAAVAHVCTINKIPFLIVRTLSDKADSSAKIDFKKFLPVAAKNSFLVVRTILKNL